MIVEALHLHDMCGKVGGFSEKRTIVHELDEQSDIERLRDLQQRLNSHLSVGWIIQTINTALGFVEPTSQFTLVPSIAFTKRADLVCDPSANVLSDVRMPI